MISAIEVVAFAAAKAWRIQRYLWYPLPTPKGLVLIHPMGWDVFIFVQINFPGSWFCICTKNMSPCSNVEDGLTKDYLLSHQGCRKKLEALWLRGQVRDWPRKNIFCVHWVHGCEWLTEERQLFSWPVSCSGPQKHRHLSSSHRA